MNNTNIAQEDTVTKQIESQTSKIPSTVFLGAAIASMAVSLTFKLMREDHKALFFGQWAAPFLLLGLYNKVVKTTGHDGNDKRS